MPTLADPEDAAAKIREAFASVPQPKGAALAPHQCPECEDIRRLLEPHSFSAVPDKDLDYLGDSLPLLGSAGLHYYLPAYLLRALREPTWPWLEMLVFHLSPSDTDFAERPDYWHERLAVFSLSQREAVRSFIDWLAVSPEGLDYGQELDRARSTWKRAA